MTSQAQKCIKHGKIILREHAVTISMPLSMQYVPVITNNIPHATNYDIFLI